MTPHQRTELKRLEKQHNDLNLALQGMEVIKAPIVRSLNEVKRQITALNGGPVEKRGRKPLINEAQVEADLRAYIEKKKQKQKTA